jgi:predicted membrane protein
MHKHFIILYFSILLHCIVQWILQVMFPSACSFIVFWFSLSFTIRSGLHGHLQVCRILHIFIFICFRILLRCFVWFAALFSTFFPIAAQNRQTTIIKNKQKTQKKNTKENSTGTKHKWKTCRVWPREKKKAANKKNTSEAESLSIWK